MVNVAISLSQANPSTFLTLSLHIPNHDLVLNNKINSNER